MYTLIVWEIIPEDTKLFLVPNSRPELINCEIFHGHFLGTVYEYGWTEELAEKLLDFYEAIEDYEATKEQLFNCNVNKIIQTGQLM